MELPVPCMPDKSVSPPMKMSVPVISGVYSLASGQGKTVLNPLYASDCTGKTSDDMEDDLNIEISVSSVLKDLCKSYDLQSSFCKPSLDHDNHITDNGPHGTTTAVDISNADSSSSALSEGSTSNEKIFSNPQFKSALNCGESGCHKNVAESLNEQESVAKTETLTACHTSQSSALEPAYTKSVKVMPVKPYECKQMAPLSVFHRAGQTKSPPMGTSNLENIPKFVDIAEILKAKPCNEQDNAMNKRQYLVIRNGNISQVSHILYPKVNAVQIQMPAVSATVSASSARNNSSIKSIGGHVAQCNSSFVPTVKPATQCNSSFVSTISPVNQSIQQENNHSSIGDGEEQIDTEEILQNLSSHESRIEKLKAQLKEQETALEKIRLKRKIEHENELHSPPEKFHRSEFCDNVKTNYSDKSFTEKEAVCEPRTGPSSASIDHQNIQSSDSSSYPTQMNIPVHTKDKIFNSDINQNVEVVIESRAPTKGHPKKGLNPFVLQKLVQKVLKNQPGGLRHGNHVRRIVIQVPEGDVGTCVSTNTPINVTYTEDNENDKSSGKNPEKAIAPTCSDTRFLNMLGLERVVDRLHQ